MKRFLTLLLLGLVAACSQPVSTSVQINQPSPLSLNVGQSQTLSATVSNNANTAVNWSSSSPNVASIEANTGQIQAISAGQTTITARSVADNSKSATLTVNVTAPPIAVQIPPPNPLGLTIGQTQNLTATVSNTLNTAVTWSSSNTSVVSVNASGRIQALSVGSSTLTARSVADDTKSATLTVNVTVPAANAGISVGINPSTPITFTQLGDTRQLNATVSGTANQGVLWRITNGGSQTATPDDNNLVAWVSQSGLVTAVGQSGTVTLTAVSIADPSKTATLSVTLTPVINSQTISGTISVPPINTQGLSLQSVQRLEGDYVPGEVLVKFRPSVSLQSLQSLSINGVDLQQVRGLADETFLFRTQNADTSSLVQSLSSRSDVLWAEPNYRVYAQVTPNDTSFADQWSLTQIRMPQAWDTTTGNANVRIAVIDSGIVSGHPDLAGKLLPGYDFVSDPQSSDDGDGRDSNPEDPNASAGWHGTHVAGIAAAATNNGLGIAGVGFNSRIIPVRGLSGSGGTTADVLDAVRWSAGITVNGLTNPNPAQVINMSLGGQFRCSNAYQEALNDALARGSIIVVAAGNSNVDASLFTPASCAGVITVGAVNRGGNRASYSNFGSRVDLAAGGGEPSDGILSTVGGSGLYERKAGTSMATPHIAGLIALMKARKDSLTAAEALSLLKTTGTAVGGVGVLVNAEAVITRSELAPTPPPPPQTLSIGSAPSRVFLRPNGSAAVTINLTRGSFAGSVSLSVSGLPSGVSGSFNPTSTTGNSSTLTLTSAASVPTATSTLTITAAGGPSGNITTTVQLDTEQPAAPPPPAQVNLQNTVIYPCVVIEDRCIFVDTNPSQSTFIVTTALSSSSYSFRPVYAGNYVVYALKDVNNNGKADAGDFNAIYLVNNVVTPVAPGAANINLTLGPIVQRQEVAQSSGLILQKIQAR